MNFIDYIKRLSEKHVDVRHDDKGEIHFLSSESEKHTAMVDELCYPCVIIDKCSGFDFAGGPGAYFKQSEYILFILDHVDDTSDYEHINKTFERTENILCQFLNKIVEDKHNPSFRNLISFRLEDVEVDYVINSDMSQYGVMALITLNETYKAKNCIHVFIE